jgi:hypothetical protein
MSKRLPPTEIQRRLQRLRNYERLYPKLRREHEDLRRKYRALQQEFAAYQETAEARMQAMELRIEQLTQMVFGRQRKYDDDHDDRGEGTAPPPERRPRPPSSFRRAVPPPEAVTERTTHAIVSCPDCGTPLRKKETVVRFIEDIPIPRKTVVEQTIERGFCPRCRKMHAALPLGPQMSTLGENVRAYILFAVTVLGQTFEKVKTHLHTVHDLTLSDGEIAAILDEGHRKLLPARNDIDARIRAAPVAHYDETGYPVQRGEQGNFAWVKTSATGPDTVFLLGRTRGKGNAEEIRGPPSDQVAVTDDYGAYDALFPNHGLCWAHPLRKFRDLARSDVLSEERRRHCQSFYERFATLERQVSLARVAPLSAEERQEARQKFTEQVAVLMAPDVADLPKLATLKRTFLGNADKYLLCITNPAVPMTNNQAERRLRNLVIKRLLSFGSRTQKGAQVMETLLSVLLTLWWSKPKDYFGELRQLIALQG